MPHGTDHKPSIRINADGIMNIGLPFSFTIYGGELIVTMPVVGGVGISSDVTCQGSIAQFNFWRSVDYLKMLPVSRLKLLYSGLSAGSDLDSYSDSDSDSDYEIEAD